MQGNYRRAREEIEEAVRLRPWAPHYQSFRNAVIGELSVYQQQHKPKLAAQPGNSPNPDRVLHVIENSLPHRTNGYTYRTQYILQGQREHGLTPMVVTRPGFPDKYGRGSRFGLARPPFSEDVDGVVHYRSPAKYSVFGELEPLDSYLQRYAEHVLDVAGQAGAGLLHAATDFKNGIAACAAARALGIPWIYEVRGIWEDTRVANGIIIEGSEGYRYIREQETWCMKEADAVVALSRRLKQDIVSRGVGAEKIFVVPNGVDPRQFPLAEKDPVLAGTLGLGDGPVIGHVGTLTSYEGLELLVQAFAIVREALPAARLLIVGDGERAAAVGQLVRRLGLAGSVRLTGRVPHRAILQYYALIDVFVVPRLPLRVCRIVTPLKPYEAMSAGRAVVLSDVGGLSELADDGAPAVRFRAGDVRDLAAKCVALARDEKRRSALGAAASEWVRRHRTWGANVAHYRDVYAWVRDKHPRRAAPD